ncbi:non-specific serine,threonine protein kinase [Sarracenia purpurea var. burkii]
MNPKFFSASNFLFAIIILVIADLPPSSCADNEQYHNCRQPFQCSGISNIGYPFWGGNRSEYCGHQSFQLNCSGEAPTITIQSRPYRVLAIDSATTTLKVVREEFWNNNCPQFLYNASLDTDHFNYVSYTEILVLYYGCRDTLQTGNTLPTLFACTANGSVGTFAIYSAGSLTSVTSNTSIQCTTSVGVQVNQTSAALELQGTGVGNLTHALNAGVGLLWTANTSACDQCINSGGLCGSNSSSPNLFACYCPNQPYPLTRNSSSPTGTGGDADFWLDRRKFFFGFSSSARSKRRSGRASRKATANCDQRVLQYYKLSDQSEIKINVRLPERWIWTGRNTATGCVVSRRRRERLREVEERWCRRGLLVAKMVFVGVAMILKDEERRSRGFRSLVFSPAVFRFRGTTTAFIEEVVLVNFIDRRLAQALAKEAQTEIAGEAQKKERAVIRCITCKAEIKCKWNPWYQ